MKDMDEKKPIIDYFELKDDIRDFSDAIFLDEKIKSGLKVTGKSVGNVGIFAGKLGFSVVKNMPTIIEEMAKNIEKNKKS